MKEIRRLQNSPEDILLDNLSLPPQLQYTNRTRQILMPQPSPLLKLPTARSDRWLLLSQFLSDWYGRFQSSNGYSEEELGQCESRLGLHLPVAFREWYRLFGRRDDVWGLQDRLLPPDQIFCGENVLHFCIENQGVTAWGLCVDDLSHDDPPVLVRDKMNNWIEQNPTTSEFAIHSAAFNVLFGEMPAQIAGLSQENLIERVTSAFPAFGFPEFIWSSTRLLGFYDLIIAIDGANNISASGLTEAALRPFRSLITEDNFEVWHETSGTNRTNN